MPSRQGRERPLLELFLAHYENGVWADAGTDWVDERLDKAVELVATRQSDGLRLAVEHTLVQPSPNDKPTLPGVRRMQTLEADTSLRRPGHGIRVDVPVTALAVGWDWGQLAVDVAAWLRTNLDTLPDARSKHDCATTASKGGTPQTVVLSVEVWDTEGDPGTLQIRKYGDFKLDEVIAKALRDKLPKLCRTQADRRILLLERDQWALSEDDIIAEVNRRRSEFPQLSEINEVWIVETVFKEYTEFKLYEGTTIVENFSFVNRVFFHRRSRQAL